jgi:cell division transport system ATP-binding protein
MLEFTNVTGVYPNGTIALRNVTFRIERGEFVFIVGPSGSGKSTLLKMIFKEESAQEGEVTVNGFKLSEMTHKAVPFLRRSLGIVFQDFRLLSDKTVFENVAFAMVITEAMKKDIRRQVPMALAMVGLSKKAKAYPHELSGGEQQRVALARAIVNKPSILLADEPTGNLDPATSREIMNLLSEINARGTTVIVASHEKGIVNEMQRRVIALDHGRLIRDCAKGGYEDETEND